MAVTVLTTTRAGLRTPSARTVLRINAVASLAMGIVALFGSTPLASAFGLARPAIVAGIGILFVLYGADAALFSVRRGLRRAHVLPFVAAEAAWVAVSAIVLVMAPHALTNAGRAAVVILAAEAAWFAVAQYRAARVLG